MRNLKECVSRKAFLILCLLACQNCAVALFLRYVRTRTDVPNAHIGCVVILQELTKFVASLAWCWYDSWCAVRRGEEDDSHKPVVAMMKDDKTEGGNYDDVCILKALGEESTAVVEREEDMHRVADDDLRAASHHHATATSISTIGVFSWAQVQSTCLHQIFNREGWKLLIPSALFSLQNTLLFVAMTHLEPTTFLVTYQLKIFTTALLMKWVLGRTFGYQKWLALGLLVAGIVLTQLPGSGGENSGAGAAGRKSRQGDNIMVGLSAVSACALSSSVAGVLMEKFMKDVRNASFLSTKNVHLSFFSMLLVGAPIAYGLLTTVAGDVQNQGLLHGVDGVVWAMIFNQALGGILVALTLRHADNILKGFATTCAIVLGGVASHALFDFIPSPFFIAGSTIVGFAIMLYGSPERC